MTHSGTKLDHMQIIIMITIVFVQDLLVAVDHTGEG